MKNGLLSILFFILATNTFAQANYSYTLPNGSAKITIEPIGFSAQGHFAYYWSAELDNGLVDVGFVLVNLVSDQTLAIKELRRKQNSTELLNYLKKTNEVTIKNLLQRYTIGQTIAANYKTSFNEEGQNYKATVAKKNNNYSLILHKNKQNKELNVIALANGYGEPEVRLLLKSPYEARLAVVVSQPYKRVGGEAQQLSVYGAYLNSGFN
jgi:hypothetical protein